jgi:hypothetical protein
MVRGLRLLCLSCVILSLLCTSHNRCRSVVGFVLVGGFKNI